MEYATNYDGKNIAEMYVFFFSLLKKLTNNQNQRANKQTWTTDSEVQKIMNFEEFLLGPLYLVPAVRAHLYHKSMGVKR